jgi:hypothetical protein
MLAQTLEFAIPEKIAQTRRMRQCLERPQVLIPFGLIGAQAFDTAGAAARK